jgi:signal transduction histidine kinase
MSEPGVSVPRWQRTLLPGGMVDAQSTRRSARDWAVDFTMLLLAIGIGAAVLAETWDDHGEVMVVVDITLGVAACIALWWRRRHPVGVALATALVSAVSASAGGAATLALFSAAIRAPRRAVGWLTLLAVAGSFLYPLVYPGTDPYALSVIVGLLATGVVVGWGLFVRVRRELVRSLHERAERVEAEQRLRVEQARDAERRRIAREMHDVLAHRVSLLSVHAGALEFRPDAPPEEIAEAAGVIRASAREALQELREVVGVLREGEDGAEPPQPTLADVPGLVEESRAAGMRVEFRAGVEEEPPDALGRTIYRVVQEGLTNARKHAPNAAVTVGVSADSGRVVVEVVSRRAVGVAAGVEPSGLPGTGTGLIGLAERVELAGGSLRHGPGPGGDFVLRAELPWPA